MLISSSQCVIHTFLHYFKSRYPFFWSCSRDREFFHVTCNHMYRTLQYRIQACIPNFVLGHTNFLQQLPWLKELQSVDLLHFFSHYIIIPLFPTRWNSWWNPFILLIGEPSDEDSNRVSWPSSFRKCSPLTNVWWALC